MASDEEITIKLSLKGATAFRRDAEKVAEGIDKISRAAQRANRNVRDLATGIRGLTRLTRDYDRAARDAERAAERLRRQTERLQRQLDRATQSNNRLGRSARDASTHVSLLSRVVGSGRSALSGMATVAGAAGLALGGAGVAATGFGLKTYAAMENSAVAFETMLGSAQASQEFIEKMKTFAVNTPFEFQDVQDYSAQLIAFGYSANDTLNVLRSIGNASSGLGMGKEGLGRLTTVIGQIKAKGRVQSDELLQLYEARVPALDILSQASGKSKAQVQADVTAGIVPAQKAIDAILAYFDKKYGGLMDKQSQTLGGLWNNFVERTKLASADAVAPLAVELKKVLPDAANAAGKGINVLGRGLGWAVKQAAKAGPTFRLLSQAFKDGGMDLVANQLDNKLGTGGKIGKTWENIKGIGESAKAIWSGIIWPILQKAAPLIVSIAEVLTRAVRVILDIVVGLTPVIKPILDDILDTAQAITTAVSFATSVIDVGQATAGGVKNAVTHPGDALSGNIPMPDKVRDFSNWGRQKLGLNPVKPPGQAKGGLTQRSGLSLVGEKGPEWLNLPRNAVVRPLGEAPDFTKMRGRGDVILQPGAIQLSGVTEAEGKRLTKIVIAELKDQIARK